MIDDIVERILLEAKGKDREDIVAAIYTTMQEVDHKIVNVISNIREEERRVKEDENKG